MRDKIRRRIENSFLFKDRCCGLSISDVIAMLSMLATGIYLYRHLNVGF